MYTSQIQFWIVRVYSDTDKTRVVHHVKEEARP